MIAAPLGRGLDERMLTKIIAGGLIVMFVSRMLFRTRVQAWGTRTIRLLDAALIIMALAYVVQLALVLAK